MHAAAQVANVQDLENNSKYIRLSDI